ncbi:MAG: tellurium resistance protein TerC [Chlorobi bacterium]|nr:tellurium resistance protein TerC [Chlorobiota bacterium]
MIENLFTLGMLILLQGVLSVDNLLYISFASRNARDDKQKFVRQTGIIIAIAFRIILLLLLIKLIQYFQDTLFEINYKNIISGKFNFHSLIVYAGGGFIVYTSIKEIWHLISYEENSDKKHTEKQSVGKVIFLIVVMNMVFSFDSILSAMALTDVLWVMITAIIISGLLMAWLSEKVAAFLEQNRMYEVLGLFILFLVGIMLLTEAGHISELTLFGERITPMNKTTFYFILTILVLIDIVQSKYKKRLDALKQNKKSEND